MVEQTECLFIIKSDKGAVHVDDSIFRTTFLLEALPD